MALVDLKSELLRLLKEDEEFRYTVAGLLGLKEILNELRKLRKDFLTFVKEQEKRWEENNRRWEESNRRFLSLEGELVKLREDFLAFVREQEKRWEETNRRFLSLETELAKLREDFLTFVKEQEKRWEENNRRWEESNRRSSRIEMELGSLSESLYCRYVSEDIEKELAAAGERVTSRMRNADFDGVEVDLAIITDRAVYIVEAKTKPTRRAVEALLAKAEAVQKRTGKPVVPILTGALIGREIEAYARSKGVRVYKY
ncbi:MAG: hypothetical protein QXF46_03190 [Thermofilaceae archaeon]